MKPKHDKLQIQQLCGQLERNLNYNNDFGYTVELKVDANRYSVSVFEASRGLKNTLFDYFTVNGAYYFLLGFINGSNYEYDRYFRR